MNSVKAYHKILPQPIKPDNLPFDIKWLSGEGCGSWFRIVESKGHYLITRFSPEGKKECRGLFSLEGMRSFSLKINFEMTYLSHCSEVNVIQNETKHTFILIEKYDV